MICTANLEFVSTLSDSVSINSRSSDIQSDLLRIENLLTTLNACDVYVECIKYEAHVK